MRERIIFWKLNLSNNYYDWVSTLIFVPFTIYFRFIGGTWLIHHNSYPESVLNLGMIAVLFGLWLLWKWFYDDRFLVTGLEKYLGIFLLIVVLSTVASSNIGLSIEIAIGIFAAVIAFYVLLDIKRSPRLWEGLINAVLIAGGLNAILVVDRILYWFRQYQIEWIDLVRRPEYCLDLLPRLPDLPSFNPNVTAVYFLMLFPLGIYKFYSSKALHWKILLFFYLVVSGIILLLTKSRGGYLGLVFAFLIWIYLNKASIKTTDQKKLLKHYLTFIFLICLALLAAIYVLDTRGFRIDQGRIQAWQTVGKIIVKNPLLGSGLGTFAERFLEYRNTDLWTRVSLHAHNEILQIAAQLGLMGLFAFLLLFWTFFRKIILIKSKFDPNIDQIRNYYFMSIAGFLGMGLVDSYLNSTNILLLLLVLMVGLLPEQIIKSIQKKKIILWGLAVVLMLLGVGDYWANWKLEPYYEARMHAFEKNWYKAEEKILQAIQRDQNNPYYIHARAQILGQIACQEKKDYGNAISAYADSAAYYYGWGLEHANYALLLGEAGKPEAAVEEIMVAIQKDPNYSLYYCLMGEYLLEQGRKSEAVDAFGECISIEAAWMDTPYWKDDQAKLEIQNKVIAQALNKINRSSVDNRLYRLAKLHYILGENIPAKQYLKELMKQEPDNLAAKLLQATILIDENNNAEADLLLDNTIELNPRSYQAWALKGIIHLDNKKPIDARGMLETSTKIRKTSYAYWLLGKTYARTGEYSQEMMMYNFAIKGWEYPSLFSNWIGYRFPIPGEKLSCMPELKTYRDHYDLAWDAIYEIGERDCCQAEGLYQQIFENEMSNSIYSNRFEDLPCSEKLDDLDCSRK